MVYGLSWEYLAGMAAWLIAGFFAARQLLLWRQKFKARPARSRTVNAGLSLWMLLAALTGLELFFAVFYDQSDSFNMSNVSKAWYERHVVRNSDGFRDHPLVKVAPAGVRQLWFCGDSFTFGHGVKRVADRFTDRVAVALDKAQPGQYLVSNVAEAGANIAQIENMLKLSIDADLRRKTEVTDIEGRPDPIPFKVDVAVYVICLNDVEPYVPGNEERYTKMGQWQPQTFPFRGTYFFNFLYFRYYQSRQAGVQNYYGDLVEAYAGRPGQRLLSTIDKMRDACAEHGTDFRVAIFPFLHTLGPNYPFAATHKLIVEHCQEAGIPVQDLAPALAPHVKEGLVCNRFDAHPNERAHALAAEALETGLLKDLMSGTFKPAK